MNIVSIKNINIPQIKSKIITLEWKIFLMISFSYTTIIDIEYWSFY